MIEKGSHTTESDQSLLDALIKGEETAFEKIYKSYFALLQNYSASIVGDSEAALEIIQNIFGPEPEQQLSALLNELPERSRQVMIMSHIENRKSADIARKLGISVRTVETILYQAMKKLRGKIKK